MLFPKNKALLHRDPRILMVVGLMAHGDFLFLNSSAELAVCDGDPSDGRPLRPILKQPAQMVQELRGTGERRRAAKVVSVVKEVLGVLVALGGGQREPVNGGVAVLRDLFAQKIELAQRILGVVMSGFRRFGQPLQCGIDLLRPGGGIGKNDLCQLVLGVGIAPPQRIS